MNLSIAEIIRDLPIAWHGELIPDIPLTGVSTDSRTVQPGELFVALRGDSFDGHKFVDAALQRGAAAALVSESWQHRRGPGLFLTHESPLTAFQEIARYYRQKFSIPVVALTGSAGKTTCKEFMYYVAAQQFETLRNQKSFNNHIGVPLTLVALQEKHELLITELGTSGFGEIDRLGELVQPDVCILLNIGYAHLEQLKSPRGIARAKMEILNHARADAPVFINADDVILREQDYGAHPVHTFGLAADADVRAEHPACDSNGCYRFTVDGVDFHLSVAGRHNIYNALAAIAMGRYFDMPMDAIKMGAEALTEVDRRLSIEKHNGMRIINDVYNANPGSCRAALNTGADIQIEPGARRVAVFGDMLELGDFSKMEHQKLAEATLAAGFDALFLYGDQTRATESRARELGMQVVYHSDDKTALCRQLLDYVKPSDLILVKGSRSMNMEDIISALKEGLC